MVTLTPAILNQIPPAARDGMQRDSTVGADGYLNKTSRENIGYAVRLEFPLSHSRDLPRMAEHLRGLAAHFDTLGRRTDISERTTLMEAKGYVEDLQRYLRQFRIRKKQSEQKF
jgi:hypothetical protein